jgi:hypothetical protein
MEVFVGKQYRRPDAYDPPDRGMDMDCMIVIDVSKQPKTRVFHIRTGVGCFSAGSGAAKGKFRTLFKLGSRIATFHPASSRAKQEGMHAEIKNMEANDEFTTFISTRTTVQNMYNADLACVQAGEGSLFDKECTTVHNSIAYSGTLTVAAKGARAYVRVLPLSELFEIGGCFYVGGTREQSYYNEKGCIAEMIIELMHFHCPWRDLKIYPHRRGESQCCFKLEYRAGFNTYTYILGTLFKATAKANSFEGFPVMPGMHGAAIKYIIAEEIDAFLGQQVYFPFMTLRGFGPQHGGARNDAKVEKLKNKIETMQADLTAAALALAVSPSPRLPRRKRATPPAKMSSQPIFAPHSTLRSLQSRRESNTAALAATAEKIGGDIVGVEYNMTRLIEQSTQNIADVTRSSVAEAAANSETYLAETTARIKYITGTLGAAAKVLTDTTMLRTGVHGEGLLLGDVKGVTQL